MKIAETNVLMACTRESVSREEENETLSIWTGQPAREGPGDRVSLSAQSKCLLTDADTAIDKLEAEGLTKHETTLKRLLVEILTGRRIKEMDPSDFQITEELEEGKHRLIGTILFEHGFITVLQIDDVLKSMASDAN